MKPLRVHAVLLALLYLGVAQTTAWAQTLELTPFAGYETSSSYPLENPTTVQALRADGGRTYGTFVDYAITSDFQAEFLWAHNPTTYSEQSAGTGQYVPSFTSVIDQYQFGGLYLLREKTDTWRPYVAGGLGFTHDSNGDGNENHTAFGLGVGGGVKYRLSRHLGIRADARLLSTHGSSTLGTACNRQMNCFPYTYHNYLQRFNLTVGLIVRP